MKYTDQQISKCLEASDEYLQSAKCLFENDLYMGATSSAFRSVAIAIIAARHQILGEHDWMSAEWHDESKQSLIFQSLAEKVDVVDRITAAEIELLFQHAEEADYGVSYETTREIAQESIDRAERIRRKLLDLSAKTKV